jgi:hypothetical protein
MRALSDVAMDKVEIYLLFERIMTSLFVGICIQLLSLFEELIICLSTTRLCCTLFFLVFGE